MCDSILNEAFNCMNNGDMISALTLFELNYEKTPGFNSCHNLAVFLSENEMADDIKDAKKYSAESLFKKIIAQTPNFYTLFAYGDLCLEYKDYEKAEKLYLQALDYKKTCSILNNLAVVEFFMQDYEKAILYFKKALSFSDKENKLYDETFVNISEATAFAYGLSGFYANALELLNTLSNNRIYMKSPDTLLLADICGKYDYVMENYKEIMRNYIITDINFFKTIAHAFSVTAPDKLDAFKAEWKNKAVIFFKENPNMDTSDLDDLLNVIDDGHYIPEYTYVPQKLFQCKFLGCNIHKEK